ncbi:MAG: FecR domain-containing protein [Proteiniphilum sp.]|uniref:FecR family protein n=1 Tax=Proteiniphilum sp. TaxID=1926877 RepID=UPI002ABBC890|nr:FecR domain-containing protein [Proteiniphilum sp.]MDY9917550.1 FecR domain-containing protein [Proteiniphilum sp.]
MLHLNGKKEYATYTVEEFLLDTFFIHSIKKPTEVSERFWSEFIASDPPNATEFVQAREILLAIKDDETAMLPEAEIDELLDNIMSINRGTKNKKSRPMKYWVGIAAGIAASVIAVIFIMKRPEPLPVTGNELLSYVEKNKVVDLNDSTVKLIISDQKMIVAEEYEPLVAYDSEEIKLAAIEIAKAESAEFNQLIVPYGKRSRLTLSDGTKIWINAGTHVIYPVEFKGDERSLYVRGEMFLDITHDKDRPFTVKTDHFDIRVLGTKFNISTYEDETNSVVLVSGAVKILQSDNSQEVFLQPNEMFELRNGRSLKKNVDAEWYTSWVNGLYMFDNERLDVVMKRLSKYYGKNIKCSPDMAKVRCSGKLDLKEKLDDILDNLSLKYTSDNNHYQIY